MQRISKYAEEVSKIPLKKNFEEVEYWNSIKESILDKYLVYRFVLYVWHFKNDGSIFDSDFQWLKISKFQHWVSQNLKTVEYLVSLSWVNLFSRTLW